jgi:hypothetical protein
MLTYYEGWDEGIMEMSLGETSILKISRYKLLRFETCQTSLDERWPYCIKC